MFVWCASPAPLSAAELKRRVLVLPFDNTRKNKNYNWMSDSIAQNLKDDLLKSERFEVLDVTLLRKIDPNMKFQNLDAKNASAVAARLNCEVAVVGRFSVRKEGKKEIVTFEADGVDALETQTVVVKNTEAPINAEIFDTVDKLAQSISDELATKLRPLDAASFKRNNKLEILIRRLENPPKGFLDDLQIIGLKLNPAFDIDTFEYEVAMTYDDMKEFPKVRFEYQYWGDRKTPVVTTEKLDCKNEDCTITGHLPVLKLAASKKPDAVSYTLRFRDARPAWADYWPVVGYCRLPVHEKFCARRPVKPRRDRTRFKIAARCNERFWFSRSRYCAGSMAVSAMEPAVCTDDASGLWAGRDGTVSARQPD
jgi:TolB-like protein